MTSTDVAVLAGVSASAVSRTYTEGASVAAATRARVRAAAEKLGYRPNAIARSLTTRRSNMIGPATTWARHRRMCSVASDGQLHGVCE